MNTKISQFTLLDSVTGNVVFPVLKDGLNFISPIRAIYTFLSGDKLINVTTSYMANSAYLLSSADLANNVYSSYNQNSGNFVTYDSDSVGYWDTTYQIVNQNYNKWNNTSTYVQNVSSYILQSNTSLVPTSSAIKNIVAITQSNYDSLPIKDPYTFYLIAS